MQSRVAVLCFVGLCGLELSACSMGVTQPSDGLLLDQILLSEQAERARLWGDPERVNNPLAHALLQSLPGHQGHAPQQAREALKNLLLAEQLSDEQQRLVRLRLLDLRYETFLQQQLQERDRRLKSLIDIERDLQGVVVP